MRRLKQWLKGEYGAAQVAQLFVAHLEIVVEHGRSME
jgi:hypothetical protein